MKYSKVNFYIHYFGFKLLTIYEVKKGKLNIFGAEIIWLFNKAAKQKIKLPKFLNTDYIETKFGKFYLTPDLLSFITVSPAFERLDTDYLEKLIRNNLKNNKVLVIDIGAYFGDYSVRLGNRFKKNKNLYIYAFEPGTEYLSASTLSQLKKNIKINNIKNIRIFPMGIGTNKKSNEIGIRTKTLDSIIPLKDYKAYDKVFIKLDIDDFVIDGLLGIEKSVKKFKKTYLLVEDFVKPKETLKYLNTHNYKFVKKLTPYNSFWERENE